MAVITKVDTVEEEWLELVREELSSFVTGSFLESSPIVCVDSLSGRGIPELGEILRARLEELPPPDRRGIFREFVDRAFNIKGYGTVVTGTVISGSAAAGDEVEILPGGTRTRIRNLQIHGHAVELVQQGDRAAVNLQGVGLGQVRRGDCLASPGVLKPSYMLDARLEILPGAFRLRNRDRLRVHVGTSELMARAVLLGREELAGGESCYAQLRLESLVTALAGDRFVIRRYSPQVTIGGGEVVDPTPRKHRQGSGQVVERLQRIADEDLARQMHGILHSLQDPLWTAEALQEKTGATFEELRQPLRKLADEGSAAALELGSRTVYISTKIHERISAKLLDKLREYHESRPELPGMPSAQLRSELFPRTGQPSGDQAFFEHLLGTLEGSGALTRDGGVVSLREHEVRVPEELREQMRRLVTELEKAAYSAPRPAELASRRDLSTAEVKRLLALCRNEGSVVQVTPEIHLSRGVFKRALNTLKSLSDNSEHGFTVSEAGKALDGAARRFSVPFLEYLDGRGSTERNGNFRVFKD